MNCVNNKKYFEFYKNRIKSKIFYSGLNSKDLTKIITLRIPLLFNLYENRLIHYEFLEEVFRYLLETKELLSYDFEKKIFSLYTKDLNVYYFLLKQLEFLQGISVILLLIRTYPLYLIKKRKFFSFFRQIIFLRRKTLFSRLFILLNNTIKRIDISLKFNIRKIQFVLLHLKPKLFIKYLKYIKVTNTSLEISNNYKILFNCIANN